MPVYRTEDKDNLRQAKMQRVFLMIGYMVSAHRSMANIMSHFDISERTAYRYLDLIESIGFDVDKDFNNKFFIVMNNCPLCGGNHLGRRPEQPGNLKKQTYNHVSSPALNS